MIKSVLESKRSCTDQNGSFSCYCGLMESYDDFPHISIQMGENQRFELTPKDYMEKVGLQCKFRL